MVKREKYTVACPNLPDNTHRKSKLKQMKMKASAVATRFVNRTLLATL